jgi:hypothetical protein
MHGLVLRWLMRPDRGGCFLAGELASPLHCLVLGVGMPSMGSRSLPPPPKACHFSKGRLVFGCHASARGGTIVMA